MAGKSFISNILLLILLNVLVKPVWILLIDRNVQLLTGHETYGLYNALMNLSLIFSILLDMGITNYNNKRIASNQGDIDQALPNLLVAKLILAPVFMLILLLAGWILQYQKADLYILFLLSVLQILSSLLLYLRSNISAHHDFKADSFLSVFDKVLMILICCWLLYGGPRLNFRIEWFIYAQIFSTGLAASVAYFIIHKRYTRLELSRFRFQQMRTMCLNSLPYAFLILLMGIYLRSGSLMLERMEGAAENGLYAEAFRLLEVLNMLGFLFAGMLLPMFARQIGKNESIQPLLLTAVHILMTISLGLVAFGYVFAQPTMQLLYEDESPYLTHIYRIVLLSFPAMSIMNIYSTLLTANGDMRLLIRIALGGSILSITLNWFMIQQWHAAGAAVSAWLVQWIIGLVYIHFSRYRLSLKIRPDLIFRFVIFFALMIGFNALFQYFKIAFIPAMLMNLPLCIGLAFACGLWTKKLFQGSISQFSS